MYVYLLLYVVTITRPPVNQIVCRDSDVTIPCGYQSNSTLPVTWIINGIAYNEEEIVNSTLYQLNSPTTPSRYSLTVFSISHTTTFQCIICSKSTKTIVSAPGRVIVTGTYTNYISYTSFCVHAYLQIVC